MHYDPRTGKLLREVPLPTPQVTSVAFGGPKLQDLYVTTAREDVSPAALRSPKFAYAGRLFKVTGLGVTGLPSQDYHLSDAALTRKSAAEPVQALPPVVEQRFELVPITDDILDAYKKL